MRIRSLVVAGFCWVCCTAAVRADVTNLANGEIFIAGSVGGSYTNTWRSDNAYQVLTETTNSRYSFLEHKWTVYVTGGTSVTFSVEAHRPANSDGDDFTFAYSMDGTVFSNMVTVTKSSDDDTPQTFALPTSVAGTVFIRVQDTNRRTGKKSLDPVCVDRLAIVCLGAPPTPSDNLLTNPGFEEGTAYWWSFSPCVLSATAARVHSGLCSGYASSRSQTWQGPVHDLNNIMANGCSYTNSVWVRMGNVASAPVMLTVKKVANGVAVWTNIASATAYSNQWTQLIGAFSLSYTGTLSELNMYVEGPASGATFYVDDAAVVGSGAWEAEADARIETMRKRDARIALYDGLGRPLTNASVEIRQTRHDFAFGSALSWWVISNKAYASFFTNHFEWAVFENETKWTWNEPEQSNVNYRDADAMYGFCASNNIEMRGHCIVWEGSSHVQDWVLDLTNTDGALMAAVSNRLDSVVPRYASRFRHWDVNNEMLHGAFYSNSLGQAGRAWMFQRTRELDPDARLFVNDYGAVSYSDTAQYVDHIRGLQAAGAGIDGIGEQCHMYEMNPYLILSRLTTLSEVGLPIWCTEFDCSHPDENERARLLRTFYKTAFSHSGVEGILMWGFWASNHWRGADAAIVDANWRTNAAGKEYESLMTSWTTVTNVAADAAGVVSFRGFHGTYRLKVVDGAVTTLVDNVGIHAGEGVSDAVLVLPGADGDGDGLPDAWEQLYGLNLSSNDASADADGDGLDNRSEYTGFTSPADDLSVPWLEIAAAPDGAGTVLSFNAADHRSYNILAKSNVAAAAWSPIFTNLLGRSGTVSVTNASPSDQLLYRLSIRLP